MGLPRFTDHLPDVPCHYPGGSNECMSITSPSARPSPIAGRVGIRDFTFEACSGFTQVTARPVAQPPKAAFVTRLRSGQLPSQTARQLPDLSTIIWVDSSSIGYPCLSGHTSYPGYTGRSTNEVAKGIPATFKVAVNNNASGSQPARSEQ